MYTRILNHVLFLMFSIFFQISIIIENAIIEKKIPELKNLEEETFGTAVLHFGSNGIKNLISVNDISKEKLTFYLKSGNDLTEIQKSTLSETISTSSWLDSSDSPYQAKKLSYNLDNADDEIVVKLKEKPITLRGLFAYSEAIKITLENFQTENVQTMEFMFLECRSLTQLEVSSLNTSRISNTFRMFFNCINLTELNLSTWDTSKFENMVDMFYNCESLTQLNVSNWNTSSVTNMYGMFSGCKSLIRLNVSNWDTSRVKSMGYMFCNCEILTQLDVSCWITSSVSIMDGMFYNCKTLTKLDLSEWDTSSVTSLGYMFYSCESLKDLNIGSFNQSQFPNKENVNYFLGNDDNLEYCRYSAITSSSMTQYFLRNCSKLISFENCGTCESDLNDEALCEKKLIIGTGDGSGSSSESITMIFHYLEEEKSLNESKRSCYWISGMESLSYFNKTLVDKYHYIQCDISCKTCEFDEKMCLTCNDGYYNLFNETTQKQKRCYDDELIIDNRFYLFNSTVYKECPSECLKCTQKLNGTSINCLICNDENRVLFGGNCIKIEEILITEELNYTYEEIKNSKLYDFLSNYINNYYDDNIFIQQFANNNIKLTIYNVGTESMNNSYLELLKLDIFKVNLTTCYENLIQKYNITNDLVYGQVDFLDNSNSVKYILYDPKTNKTINMDICENMDISISKNIELSEELKNIINNAINQGYNIVDINDSFYNDVCTPYNSINGTDITISDRIADIYGNNFEIFVYYDECNFESFNLSENNVTVICKTKTNTNFFNEKNDSSINFKQLLSNFKFCEASNFYVIKCYKEFLSKEGQSNNYANYIYYIIIAVTLILFVVYFCTGINYLEIKLAKIAIRKKYSNITKQKSTNAENVKKQDFFLHSNSNDFPSSKNQLSNNKNLNLIKKENPTNPPKKISSYVKRKLRLKTKENSNINYNDQIILTQKNKINIKNVEKKTKKLNNDDTPFEIITLEENGKGQKTQNKIGKETLKEGKNPEEKIENKSIVAKKKKKVKKINIKNLTDIELNEFYYEEALKYDKRTFMQLYLSYLRLKHPILSLLYDDYNIFAIKSILFVHSFGSHVCTNGLFFREDTMHQIYIDNGRFNFIYRLPLTLYSVVISAVISISLKKLGLTQSCIIQYKKQIKKLKNRNEVINIAVGIIKCFKIKFIIFVVLILFTLFAFWFYIGCFCTVYHNTQFILLKDSLIGFGTSMLYPLGLFSLAGLLRISALKKSCPCLYQISKLIA